MDILTELKKHELEIKERFGVKKIGLFGSRVKGEQKKTSDIDILVEFIEPNFDHFMDLSFFLEDLFGNRLDLITTKGISPYMVPIITKEVVWA